VTRQLTQRFGDLPEVAAQRLAHADSATLEAIADRLLTAPDLAAALGS
jgi:hypothetical protein